MTSTRPYLVRAMYDWIIDNGMTPHLLVDTKDPTVMVPRQYEQDDKIVLNISPSATQSLSLNDETVEFQARFDGEPTSVYIPMQYVMAIYTKENGQGMMFNEDTDTTPTLGPGPAAKSTQPAKPKVQLKIVK